MAGWKDQVQWADDPVDEPATEPASKGWKSQVQWADEPAAAPAATPESELEWEQPTPEQSERPAGPPEPSREELDRMSRAARMTGDLDTAQEIDAMIESEPAADEDPGWWHRAMELNTQSRDFAREKAGDFGRFVTGGDPDDSWLEKAWNFATFIPREAAAMAVNFGAGAKQMAGMSGAGALERIEQGGLSLAHTQAMFDAHESRYGVPHPAAKRAQIAGASDPRRTPEVDKKLQDFLEQNAEVFSDPDYDPTAGVGPPDRAFERIMERAESDYSDQDLVGKGLKFSQDMFRDWAESQLPEDHWARRDNVVQGAFMQGLGSMVPLVLAFGRGGPTGGVTTAAGMGAYDFQQDALENLGDEELSELDKETVESATKVGVAMGTSQIAPIATLFNRLKKPLERLSGRKNFVREIGEAALVGVQEATLEGFYEFAKNATANNFEYDPERSHWENVKEAAGMGGAVGFTATLIMRGMLRGKGPNNVTMDGPESTTDTDPTIKRLTEREKTAYEKYEQAQGPTKKFQAFQNWMRIRQERNRLENPDQAETDQPLLEGPESSTAEAVEDVQLVEGMESGGESDLLNPNAQQEPTAAPEAPELADATFTPLQATREMDPEPAENAQPEDFRPVVDDKADPATSTTFAETIRSDIDGKPASYGMAFPGNLKVDAEAYQHKQTDDPEGRTDRFTGDEKWDPSSAGTVIIHRREDGDYVADGHQRAGLARARREAGENPSNLFSQAIILNEADGWTPQEVRLVAAFKNVRQETGTAIDAAKLLREGGDAVVNVLGESINPKRSMWRDAQGLAGLSDPIFQEVINGVVPVDRGAIIGKHVTDPAKQRATLQYFQENPPGTQYEAEIIARDINRLQAQEQTQGGLDFGDAVAQVPIKERAKILDAARKLLNTRKKVFRQLVKDQSMIEGEASNVLDKKGNVKIAQDAENVMAVLNRMVDTSPELNEVLNNAANQLANGETTAGNAAKDLISRSEKVAASVLGGQQDRPGERQPTGAQEPGQRAEQEAPGAVQPEADESATQSLIPDATEGGAETTQAAEPEAQAPTEATEANRYALVNRPAGFESLPKGIEWSVEPRPDQGQPHHDLARHGVLVTDRPLTDEEIESYELGRLVDDHSELADQVADELSDYADQMGELSLDEATEVVMAQLPEGRMSIADPEQFVKDVVGRVSRQEAPTEAAPVDEGPQGGRPRFIEAAMRDFDMTAEQAEIALDRLMAEKMVTSDVQTGQFTVRHGSFWDRDVFRRAAGLESEQDSLLADQPSQTQQELEARRRETDERLGGRSSADMLEGDGDLFAGPRPEQGDAFDEVRTPAESLPEKIPVDGRKRPTTDSEGRQIHPTREGVEQFWRWFGDSKVADENGEPLVVYHGTTADFTAFDPNESEYPGLFFMQKADQVNEIFDRASGASVIPAYLSLENPLYVDVPADIGGAIEYADGTDHEAIYQAKREGRDGVIYRDPGGDSMFVAFRPEQIKSATGNTGAFRSEASDISEVRTDQDMGWVEFFGLIHSDHAGPVNPGREVLPAVQEKISDQKPSLPANVRLQGVDWISPTEHQQMADVMGAAISDLVDAGFPIEVVESLDGFMFGQSPDTRGRAGFYWSGGIGANDKIMAYLADNPNDVDAHRVFRLMMAHEMGHRIDRGANGDSLSEKSPLFDMEISPDGREIALGDVIHEMYVAYLRGTEGLTEMLRYPFERFDDRNKAGTLNQDVIDWTKREAFAQIAGLYYTWPESLRQAAPRAWQMMEEINNAYRDAARTFRGARAFRQAGASVQRALRVQQAGEPGSNNVERANRRDDRAGAGRRRGARRVARGERGRDDGGTGPVDEIRPDSDGRSRKERRENLEDLYEAMERAGLARSRKPLREWISDLQDVTWKAVRDRHRAFNNSLIQGTLDRFHGIKVAEERHLGNLPTEQSGYVAARLSTGVASIMRSVMLHGAPVWRDGIIQQVDESQGLLQILKPVKSDLNTFLGWMVGRRARRLASEGRENLFEGRHIEALIEAGENSPVFDQFQEVADNLEAFKHRVLDVAEQAGLIDPEARAVWDHAEYLPFYRVSPENEGRPGPSSRDSLSGQSSGIRNLRGGTERLNDPLENILMNFTHLLDAAVKNMAIVKVKDNLGSEGILEKVGMVMKSELIPMEQVKKILEEHGIDPDTLPEDALKGIRKMWAITPPAKPDVVRIMEGGKASYYRVLDPLLLRALTAIRDPGLNHPIVNTMRGFKRILTRGVTADPAFMLRNAIRDSLHAWTISEDHFRLGVDSIRGVTKTLTETGGSIDMMFAGGSFLGGYVNATDPKQTSQAIRVALRERGYSASARDRFLATVVDTPLRLWEMYTHIGDAVENASREAVYEAAMKAGKSKARAVFEAKDLMDYSMRGDWAIVQFFTDVIPFLNARVQGLYKLGRAGHNAPARVAARGSIISLFALALLALNKDDERYEQLQDWDKDTYWHIFFPKELVGEDFWHIRIPKPFEIGVLFGTIPERIALNALDKDDNEKTFERFIWAIRQTFAFDPIPQMVGPPLELAMNRNRFLDQPIEGMGDEGRLPAARYDERTSATMRALGRITGPSVGMSPKQLEHLWRGYTGQMGMYVLDVVDVASRAAMDMPPRPTWRIDEYPVIRSFLRAEPAWSSKYMTELYDLHREVDQIYRTIRHYERTGEQEKALELLEENTDKLSVRDGLRDAVDENSKISKEMERIMRSEDMTPEEKRKEIDYLISLRNDNSRRTMKTITEFFDSMEDDNE